ncbi:hypothetical protein Ancab_029542 [Ancistrocladus abbreviatus]
MAFSSGRSSLLFTILVMSIVLTTTALKEFSVGGRQGWRIPDANDSTMYNDWAGRERFHVGDALRFRYQNDSVLVVDKYGYYHCSIEDPISSYTDGNTLITLDRSGLFYFTSGDVERCKNGQRLIVDVMSPHQHFVASPPDSDVAISPGPSSSSAAVVSGALISILLALVATSVSVLWCEP